MARTFDEAAADVKKLKKTPADKDLLELYGLYKQATFGNVNTERPGMIDFKGKAKWDAWNGRKGKTQEAAKEEYIEVAKRLIEKDK